MPDHLIENCVHGIHGDERYNTPTRELAAPCRLSQQLVNGRLSFRINYMQNAPHGEGENMAVVALHSQA